MSTRGLSIGANGLTRASHIAPGARRDNIIPLARRCPPPPSPSVAWSRAQETTMHSFRASMQTGTNPSLGLFASAFEGLCGEENAPHSFPSRSSLKFFQIADAVFEVAKALLLFLMCLFGGAVIAGSILSWLFIVNF